jgi:hypothetical protein
VAFCTDLFENFLHLTVAPVYLEDFSFTNGVLPVVLDPVAHPSEALQKRG